MLSSFRDFFSEFRLQRTLENSYLARVKSFIRTPGAPTNNKTLRLNLKHARTDDPESQHTPESLAHYKDVLQGYAKRDFFSNAAFEFFKPLEPSEQHGFPNRRKPSPGIISLPFRFHKTLSPQATTELDSHFLDDRMSNIIYSCFPQYAIHVYELCRPSETQDSTFNDFNKEQKEYPPIPTDLSFRIIHLIIILLNALPFRPLHYVDTFFTGLPLSTGVSYFYRHSYDVRTHAHFNHPTEYATKTTSKGYFLNTFAQYARTIIHRIKETSYPFDIKSLSISERKSRLRTFFMEHATNLFTRSQISKRLGPYKLRPVYAMDTLFLTLETMITYPLHVLARSTKSCILYSYETIRGGCSRLDALAQRYTSFLCIDWSSFDQRVPFIIIDLFFTTFLPLLLIISHGYQPTPDYPIYPDLTTPDMFHRLFNIIQFLRTWYFNCVFVTHDGFAYVRTLAGIASGMLNTQYLDSFCNLFLMIHALIHFGCTDLEILEIMFFVLGDDNVLFTTWSYPRLNAFLTFLETHSLDRFGMILSPTKSLITPLRSRIEILGYQCNLGTPRRPIDKLTAQLVYPEHGFKPEYMSDRAIGIAYASAGCDSTFYAFCKSVHSAYLPDRRIQPKSQLARYAPGYLKLLDIEDLPSFDFFPTLSEIQSRYSNWKGQLPQDRKWSPAHFLNEPNTPLTGVTTMYEYMTAHNITFPKVDRLFDDLHDASFTPDPFYA
jgi:hypothetical protein